jgi:hypothetical protein
MTDLKAGLPDAEIMDKYGISFQGLQDLFSKLQEAGLVSAAYFNKRALKQMDTGKPKEQTTKTCPYCGYSDAENFRRCPRCEQDTTEWLDTVELTKILTGSFGE